MYSCSIHRYEFDRRYRLLTALQSLTLQDVVQSFNTHIRINSPQRKKFSTLVFGGKWSVPDVAVPLTPVVTEKDGTEAAPLAAAPKNNQVQVFIKDMDYVRFQRTLPLFPHLV